VELKACKLFEGLPDKELKKIQAEMLEVTHPAGKKIMVRGDNGVGFMVIREGEAEAVLPNRTVRMKPGDHFGEMALLDHQGRSASIVAVTPLTVSAITAWEFESFLAAHPKVAYRMLQTMSRRLREADNR
jgi:CRP-like cAMP-binding protein